MNEKRALCFAVSALFCLSGLLFSPAQSYGFVSQTNASATPSMALPNLPDTGARLQYEYQDLVIQRQDLLFTGFQRPGTAANIHDNKGLYQAQVFSHRDNTPLFFTNSAGPMSPTELSYGGTLHMAGSDNVAMEAGYVGGQLQWTEEDQQFNPHPTQGVDSWNLTSATQWWDNTFSTRMEYAQSDYQDQSAALQGQAMQAEMNISSGSRLNAGWFDRWSGKASFFAVDDAFYSLGNPYLVKGLNRAQLLLHSDYRRIGLDLEWTQEGRCQQQRFTRFAPNLDRAGIRLQYRWDQSLLATLGTPTLSARYYQIDQRQDHDQVINQGYEDRQNNFETGLNLAFAHPAWNWSLDYLESDQDHWRQALTGDATSMALSDWRHKTLEFNLSWNQSDLLRLNLNARWNNQFEIEPANRFQYRNLGVQAHLGQLRHNLSLDMEYYYGNAANNIDGADQLITQSFSQTGNTQLTWKVQQWQGVRPAMDLYLRGSYNRQYNLVSAMNDIQWTTLVGVEMFWDKRQ